MGKTVNFTVIYKTSIPSILIEYAFYTNKEDLKILKYKKDELVEATVIAICKYFNMTYKLPTQNNESYNNTSGDSNVYYRVIAGSYKNKSNSEDIVKELKNKGYSAFIVTYKE